jgi:hypothetical protein
VTSGPDRIPAAFMRATPDDLLGAFPGWRAPLSTPREYAGIDPFTKQPTIATTRDPGGTASFQPSLPPVPYVEFTGLPRWPLTAGTLGASQGPLDDLAMLYAVMVSEDGTDEERDEDEPTFPTGIFGGRDVRVLSLPSAFSAKLAETTAECLQSVAKEWVTASRGTFNDGFLDAGIRALATIAAFAREAAARGEELFYWDALGG